jgi:hypothetical protein
MKGAELDQHQAECPKRRVFCPNPGCGSLIAFDDVNGHKAHYCELEEVACPFAEFGCTARMLRKGVDSHEDTAMKQHNRLLLCSMKQQRQLIESLKDQVMPDNERIVLQVKYDELTGKAPFFPPFPNQPTDLFSEDRVVRGYTARLYVAVIDGRPEYQDHFGVYLEVEGGPLPCKVLYAFELVHHDGNNASRINDAARFTYTDAASVCGCPNFIAKARLASPDNNPYVKDGYVTFKCTFKFV